MSRLGGTPVHRRVWLFGGIVALLAVLGACEALGWPFLVGPVQRRLSLALDRPVALSDGSAPQRVAIHLLGHVRLDAGYLEVGAPAWSKGPHLLLAHDVELTLGYLDLWRAARGGAVRVRSLTASQLDVRLERLADGRASWQFGAPVPANPQAPAAGLPTFGRLQVESGQLHVADAMTSAEFDATFSLRDASAPDIAAVLSGASGASGASAASAAAAAAPAPGAEVASARLPDNASQLRLDANGTYLKQPLTIEVRSAGVLSVVGENGSKTVLPVTIQVRSSRASFDFVGTATDALHLGEVQGRFTVQGPSLAAVGDPVHVTLPTTGPFRATGLAAKRGEVWNVVLDDVSIGSSRLGGAFTYDPRSGPPLLAGRLTGSRLALRDLGPAFGGAVPSGAPAAPAPRKAVPGSKGAARAARGAAVVRSARAEPAARKAVARPGRMLPDRDFDLPALRAMDASVLVDIASVDLNASFLEPLRPLRGHVVLSGGVLTLRELDARTGQGQLGGTVQFDGRNAQALWTSDLHFSGVRLESWIHQARSDGAPPYATGVVDGQARVAGQGKSTATILGSLRGGIRMQWTQGTVSHLAIEAAGLDVAQGLGVLLKGDDALTVRCSVVDLVAEQGVLKPRVFVIDTKDSTLWLDGNVSLATEAIDLRVVTTPQDFSPLALRTPVHLRGTFSDPAVSVEVTPLAARVGAAALLALINPVAALIPFADVGNGAAAQHDAQACRDLSQRVKSRPSLPSPGPAKAVRTAPKR